MNTRADNSNSSARNEWTLQYSSPYGIGLLTAVLITWGVLVSPSMAQEQVGPSTNESRWEFSSRLGIVVASSPGFGVLVVAVEPSNAAASAGIRAGDYILSVDERNVSDAREVLALTNRLRIGTQVRLVTLSNGKKSNLLVPLSRGSALERSRLGEIDSPDQEATPRDRSGPLRKQRRRPMSANGIPFDRAGQFGGPIRQDLLMQPFPIRGSNSRPPHIYRSQPPEFLYSPYATPRKTRFRPLVRRYRTGFPPAGFR